MEASALTTIDCLKDFAAARGIEMPPQKTIVKAAQEVVTARHGYTPEQIKANFDDLLLEIHDEIHDTYRRFAREYAAETIEAFVRGLAEELDDLTPDAIAEAVARHNATLDAFYLSLAQSRKSRAGKTFEVIHNTLFKTLGYPFDEQQVINGKPDFVMPSVKHFRVNPMGCVIFTAKRTLRERWRQIVTEGTRGLGFYLATIDEKISANQRKEMLDHRIYVVVPEKIRAEHYDGVPNVLSFRQFFEDHLDPKMVIWRREGLLADQLPI
jgi:hypothetical protein